MIEVGGRRLIDRALAHCADIPVRVANTHYLPDSLEAHLSEKSVQISREAQLLDTGGGLKAALPLIGADVVLTLNSDAVWAGPSPLECLDAHWDMSRMDALLALVPLERAVGRLGGGDFSLEPDGRLRRKGSMVYTGAQLIRADVVKAVGEDVFSLNLVWDKAARSGRLFGVEWPGYWGDVGHPEGIGEAERLLERTGYD
jgi:MurNAc alpha-1-phosphate uridylyltransferase